MRVIKTIRFRQYYYEQHSVRVNGKVVTKSVYLGPVHPRRRRRGEGGLTFGLLALLINKLKGVKDIYYNDRFIFPKHERSVTVLKEDFEEKRAKAYRDWKEFGKLPRGIGAPGNRSELLKSVSAPAASVAPPVAPEHVQPSVPSTPLQSPQDDESSEIDEPFS